MHPVSIMPIAEAGRSRALLAKTMMVKRSGHNEAAGFGGEGEEGGSGLGFARHNVESAFRKVGAGSGEGAANRPEAAPGSGGGRAGWNSRMRVGP
jgi:hypothetical protein